MKHEFPNVPKPKPAKIPKVVKTEVPSNGSRKEKPKKPDSLNMPSDIPSSVLSQSKVVKLMVVVN